MEPQKLIAGQIELQPGTLYEWGAKSGLRYRSTKTYGHELGFSCCFRQHRANSHCSLLHGYSLGFFLEFEARTLDERGWVVDFGSLSDLKAQLAYFFDHTCLVAEDDPEAEWFREAERRRIMAVRWMEKTGCEAIAELVGQLTVRWLAAQNYSPRVSLKTVRVMEHGANSASVVFA